MPLLLLRIKYQTLVIWSKNRLWCKYKRHDANAKDIEGKYFTTSDYNKFTNNIFNAKIKTKKLVNKSDISEFINNTGINKKIERFATKIE